MVLGAGEVGGDDPAEHDPNGPLQDLPQFGEDLLGVGEVLHIPGLGVVGVVFCVDLGGSVR